ncbi:MFS transporter [Marisediminicola senii]|uniref:MFS transporter n=1 Tax=Marisediminicola senii TaxID=2711233 RepID=UPI0013EAF32F|nr:MFS transporter [Marisediminicola senii]
MNSRRSWLVWGIALIAYVVSVLQRTTLGVSGVDAAERYSVSASVLSSLAVVQLIVYALLQIPVGVILDRLGPRVMICVGAALMASGQLTLAIAPGIGEAVVGRILVGAGDAFTFISVIRLLTSWFSGRILPQVSQWTGNLGQLGQVLSAVPFSFVLHDLGWSAAFISAASLSVLAAVLVLVLVRDGPARDVPVDRVTTLRDSVAMLGQSLRRTGTQLGFWSHFVTQSSGTMFTLLWGFPVLTVALGYIRGEASAMLSGVVLCGMVAGPIIGILTARFPTRRSSLVLGIVAMMAASWTAVLAWPGAPPLWLVIVLIVTLGIGGPGSLIGFDFARTFNPLRSLGSANGFVNVGGFSASFIMMFLVGVILDGLDRMRIDAGAASDIFGWDSFRIAFLVQYIVMGTGVIFVIRTRRRTRRQLHQDERIAVAPLWVALVRAWRRRSN